MNTKKLLHFNEFDRDFWATIIISKLREAYEKKEIENFSQGLVELATYISIKLKIISYLITRINKEHALVIKAAKKHDEENVFTENKEGYAFSIDDKLKYELISDIESFLFQTNSCWELMIKYTIEIHRVFEKHMDTAISKIFIDSNHSNTSDTKWIPLLKSRRNFFTHEGGAYLALDVTSNNPDSWELILLRKNVKFIKNLRDYYKFSDLYTINIGFNKTRELLKDHILKIIQTNSEKNSNLKQP